MTATVECIINGLPGNMGVEITRCCLRRGVGVCNFALTGDGCPPSIEVSEGQQKVVVRLIQPSPGVKDELRMLIREAESKGRRIIAVDFTHPSAVNKNAQMYCDLNLPFVMGTTGGDRDALLKTLQESKVYALIAPNMCKQIVAFQLMLETISSTCPGSFSNYRLEITESHQASKADTSGTALHMVQYFNELIGDAKFNVERIQKLRDAPSQLAFGVPEDALSGHAWHTYKLISEDGSAVFEFKHNVCGRQTYAEGVVDSVVYLSKCIDEGTEKRLFTMIDVLKNKN